jgi:lysophospholipase L1-like esterase
MIVHIARIVLAPIIYAQAFYLRTTIPLLPEPEGLRSGIVGTGRPLRLLITGDSSAVGVGADTQESGLALPLTRALSTRLDAAVHWQLSGKTGLTSEGLLKHLTQEELQPADIALVVLGANDITNEVSLRRALRCRGEIVSLIRQRTSATHIVFTGVPEMQVFPALPHPLAWYAGLHASRNNRVQSQWAKQHRNVHHADIGGLARADIMGSDGYHPSPALYALVANRLAEVLFPLYQSGAENAATALEGASLVMNRGDEKLLTTS